jgi:aspartyl-tRNA(Asn)/glutamyl-tRNA(Gln) amidotransferase subunit C
MTSEQIAHIARLARLRFSPEALDGFTAQFNQILAYVEKLNEVDTEGVEPMANISRQSERLRDDEPGPLLTPAEALSNAPRRNEGFFTIPKVIGDAVE